MAWVKFTADYDHRLPSGAVIAYKADMVENVVRGCADRAVEAQRAVRLKAPRKGEAPTIAVVDSVESVSAEGWVRSEPVVILCS